MTTPEPGRTPAVVLRADVSQYLAGLSAAERATLRLSRTIQRDMAGATASINAATAALRQYTAAAAAASARIPAARVGGVAATVGAVGSLATDRAAREASRLATQRERSEQAIARSTRQRQQEQERAANRSADVMGKAADRIEQALRNTARNVVISSASIAAGLVVSARAAIEWESAWAGVRKTVDGSVTELAALERQLRGLATTMPTTHREIAAIAEAAGQMGIQSQNIASFTRTVIQLSQTTNLTADAAATGLAKFTNVMGTAQDQANRLGATLVALGNDGASTEAEILAMAQRVSGAGKTIGLTEDQVLALASATSDLGVEAELGGGALQRVMLDTYKAVQSGGDSLERFAQVARMPAEAFAELFRQNPAAAFQSLIAGLRQTSDEGGNLVAAMEAIGAEGTLDISVLTRLVGGMSVLNDAFTTAGQAWRKPLALLEEFEKRAETTAAKLQVARNQLKDTAISVGGALLPDVAAGAEGIRKTAAAAQSLPGPLGEIVLSSVKTVALLGLLAGSFALLAPRIIIAHYGLKTLSQTMPGVAKNLAALRRGFILLGVALLAIGAAQVGIDRWSKAIDRATGRRVDLVELRRSLLDLVEASREAGNSGNAFLASGETARLWGSNLSGIARDMQTIQSAGKDEKLGNWFRENTGLAGKLGENIAYALGGFAPFDEAKDRVEGLDQALTDFVENGMVTEAAELIGVISAQSGRSVADIVKGLDGYKRAMAGVELAAETQKRAQEKTGKSAATMAERITAGAVDLKKFEEAVEDVDVAARDLNRANAAIADSYVDIEDNAKDARDAILEVRDAVAEASKQGLDPQATTDAFIASRNKVLTGNEDENGNVSRALGDGSPEALANNEDIRSFLSSFIDWFTAQIPEGATPEQVAAELAKYLPGLQRDLNAAGFDPSVTSQMIGASVAGIPGAFAAETTKSQAQQNKEAADRQVLLDEEAAKSLTRVKAFASTEDRTQFGADTDFRPGRDAVLAQIETEKADLEARLRARGANDREVAARLEPLNRLAEAIPETIVTDKNDLELQAQGNDLLAQILEEIKKQNGEEAKRDEGKQAATLGPKALEYLQQKQASGTLTPDEQAILDGRPLPSMSEGDNPPFLFSGPVGSKIHDGWKRIPKPWASGGFTGPGAMWDPAGVVHKGEFVINAARTRQWLPLLQAIHSGQLRPPGVGVGSGGPRTKLMWGRQEFDPFGRGLKYPRSGMPPWLPPAFAGAGRYQYASGGYVGGGFHSPPATPVINVQAPAAAPVAAGPGSAQAITVTVPVYLNGRQIATATGQVRDVNARTVFS